VSYFVGNAEYFAIRRIGKWPVRVYQDIGRERGEATFCVAPVARGGWLDGCLAQGATLDEAIDRLAAMMPSTMKFWRREVGMSPKPVPWPAVTLGGLSVEAP